MNGLVQSGVFKTEAETSFKSLIADSASEKFLHFPFNKSVTAPETEAKLDKKRLRTSRTGVCVG